MADQFFSSCLKPILREERWDNAKKAVFQPRDVCYDFYDHLCVNDGELDTHVTLLSGQAARWGGWWCCNGGSPTWDATGAAGELFLIIFSAGKARHRQPFCQSGRSYQAFGTDGDPTEKRWTICKICLVAKYVNEINKHFGEVAKWFIHFCLGENCFLAKYVTDCIRENCILPNLTDYRIKWAK